MSLRRLLRLKGTAAPDQQGCTPPRHLAIDRSTEPDTLTTFSAGVTCISPLPQASSQRSARTLLVGCVLAGAAVLLAGCAPTRQSESRDWYFGNPYDQPRSLAVTVFINQSGVELDMMMVTDQFYTELQQLPGEIKVVPVNRMLATLREMGLRMVRGPEDVQELADRLDVDGVIVGSVTRYDPYPPPVLGMAVQLYNRPDSTDPSPATGPGSTETDTPDPMALSRSARPFELSMDEQLRPQAMVVRIFDADQAETIQRINTYAEDRQGQQGPLAWKRYTTQEAYIGFVSHEIIGELMGKEKQRLFREQLANQ